MERLSTQPAAQDANACIALCYQLNQPINVQSVDGQTAVAVQSLLDSQVVADTQDDDEDVFQCGKCKKQFTSLTTFVAHKQTQCTGTQQQQQHAVQQQQIAIQQPQQSQLNLGAGPSAFASTINLNRSFQQAQLNGTVSTINTNAPILQAHPCLTRSLNQANNAHTLTLGGVSSSPISQLSQNVVFTDEIMALTNLDSTALGTSTIQMVAGPIGQTANNSNGMTIFSPITSLAGTQNTFNQAAGPGQLLVQPAQHITLTTITDKSLQQQQHQQQQQQPAQAFQQQPQQQTLQQQHQQQLSQPMPPPAVPPTPAATITVSQPTQQTIQPQIFKPSPTKAGRRSAQNNFITVLNPDNSVSLLSTRKGKTARNAKNNVTAAQEEINPKPKLQCEYCSKQFAKNFDLQQHVRAHTGEKPYQCIVCGRAFAQKSNVKKHMATHKVWPGGTSNTLPKQPEPVIEDKGMSQSQSSATEESSSSSPPPSATTTMTGDSVVVTSSSMSFVSDRASQLLKTTVEQASDDEDGPKVKVVVDNSYICQYCPAKFKSYYQLKTHLVKHKNEQVYKCVVKECGQSFYDLDTFLEHIKTHENDMTYRCHQCHKYFKNLSDLGLHQYTHIYNNQGVKSGPRHFQCTKCGNKYTTPEALEHHMSTTSHNYKCIHCNKQFTCERFLRRHLPIHGSEGHFECPHCKKRFKTDHYLKSHMLIHTGETPFTCEICPAAFNRKDKLKRHMTIHDAVKKYRCPFRSIAGCTKEFNRPDKLKAHIITHSGIKPFKCTVCSKGFSRRPHLIEHERGHALDFKYKCEKCGKGFFRPKLFNEHKCVPTKYRKEQQFRPRNRRKIGRPKKRMISIAPDSVSKSRGKQYPSRTRTNANIMQQFSSPAVAEQVSVKQRLRQQQQEKQLKANAIIDSGHILKSDSNRKSGVGQAEPKSVSVEVVKALPVLASSVKGSNVIDVDSAGNMSVHIPGLEGVKGDEIGDALGNHVQQISLGPGGELVDHYVVHLTESVDGSGPTIQTAFIPAVSGGQIFASNPGGMGIQPIAIIEARPFNMATSDANETQILTADGTNAIISSGQGSEQNEGQAEDSISVSRGYITVTQSGHVVSDAKHDIHNRTMIMLSDGTNVVESNDIIAANGGDVMVSGQRSAVTDSGDGATVSEMVESQIKEEAVMVIGDHNMMVSAGEMVEGETEAGADMMDSSLSLFAPPSSGDSYVGGQVVVSGDQAYITCSSHLVDYSTGDTVLHGPT